MPVEVTTDRAPAYPRVLDELIPSANHSTEQFANHDEERQPPGFGDRFDALSLTPGCGVSPGSDDSHQAQAALGSQDRPSPMAVADDSGVTDVEQPNVLIIWGTISGSAT